MAAGGITYDAGNPVRKGETWQMSGVIEVDDTKRNFAITSTSSTLLSFMLIDSDGVGSAWSEMNENAAGAGTNGTVAVAGNHQSVDSYWFIATYV